MKFRCLTRCKIKSNMATQYQIITISYKYQEQNEQYISHQSHKNNYSTKNRSFRSVQTQTCNWSGHIKKDKIYSNLKITSSGTLSATLLT